MSMNDPLSDMFARIRNGQAARKATITCPASNLLGSVLEVLKREGFIADYRRAEKEAAKPVFEIDLKYADNEPVIRELKRVSTPGRRVYAALRDLPKVFNGLGISILSTSKGVMSDFEARQQNVGGEVLCTVF